MCEKISEPFPYTIDRASVYLHALPELSGEMCDELPYGTRLRTVGEKYTSDTGSIWYRCETDYGYCRKNTSFPTRPKIPNRSIPLSSSHPFAMSYLTAFINTVPF